MVRLTCWFQRLRPVRSFHLPSPIFIPTDPRRRGSASIDYDSLAASVDRFTWENPDFLPVFAAGGTGGLILGRWEVAEGSVCAVKCTQALQGEGSAEA